MLFVLSLWNVYEWIVYVVVMMVAVSTVLCGLYKIWFVYNDDYGMSRKKREKLHSKQCHAHVT